MVTNRRSLFSSVEYMESPSTRMIWNRKLRMKNTTISAAARETIHSRSSFFQLFFGFWGAFSASGTVSFTTSSTEGRVFSSLEEASYWELLLSCISVYLISHAIDSANRMFPDEFLYSTPCSGHTHSRTRPRMSSFPMGPMSAARLS